MLALESLLLSVMICTCIIASITDIKECIIPNKLLLISGGICLVLNSIYYSLFAKEYILSFLLNFVILVVLSILLYSFNLWAAGDSKLLFLIVFAIPSRYYFTEYQIGLAPAIFIIVFTFSISFLYIVAESVYIRVKNKEKIDFLPNRHSIINYLKNYLFCTIYIVLFNYAFMLLFPSFASENASLITIFNLFITIIIYKYDFFFKLIPLAVTFCFSLLTVIIHGTLYGFGIPDWRVYLYLAIIMFLRNISEKFNYETIPTAKVKKGMILSTATIMMMAPSRIQGLPEHSTEDMRSRLTDEQVDSIKRWENSKYGMHEITIVRKIPFAIFMTVGVILFLLIRMGII